MKKWRQAIYAMQSLDGVAAGLIGIFIPIYFLTLGYSLSQVFYYFIVNNLVILSCFFVVGFLAARIGFSKVIFFRLPFLFFELFFLYNLKVTPEAFYLIAILNAIEVSLYWFTVHAIFAKSVDRQVVGAQVGNLFAIPTFFGLLIPLIGASISALFGFQALFLTSGIFYLVSTVPLVFVGKIPVEIKISLSRIIDYCRRYKKYFATEVFLNAIGEIEGYILPIFLFLTFNNILSVGILSSFLGLGSAIFTLFVGKFSDNFDKQKIFRAGVFAMILVWFGRFFASTQVEFYVLSILAGFFGVLISIPFTSLIYKNAKDNHVEDFIIFREIPVAIGRVCFYLLALLLVSQIKLTFLIATASYLALLLF